MLKSMTAYGRSSLSSPLGIFVVEIQSVNRKHLEINTALPEELLRFDVDIKTWIAAQVSRGSLNVKIRVSFEKGSPLKVTPNLPLARQLKQAWDAIADDLNLKNSFNLSLLAKVPGLFAYDYDLNQEEKYREILFQAVSTALENLNAMKRKEGTVLESDIRGRIKILFGVIQRITALAPNATDRYRQKLKERLEEIVPGCVENEEKILREVAIFADRIDITEEIIRFNSLLVQFEDLLKKESNGIGKTLDFLTQELNREVNTIGSKSSNHEVTKCVIEAKSELEKIREQIQNIE